MKVLKEEIMAVLPDECLICNENFDKKAPDILNEWHIIQEDQHIGLYCSFCWEHSEEVAGIYLRSKGSFLKN
tara:strand:- start:129 stop:344 length:216 start_codon:yes stop_codon:yes gene_type:complete